MSKKLKKRVNGSPTLWTIIQDWGNSKYFTRLQLIDVFTKIGLGCDVTFTAIKGESEKFTFSNPEGDAETVWLISDTAKLDYYNCDFAIVGEDNVIDFYKIDNMVPVLSVTEKIRNFENVSIKAIISKAKQPAEVTYNLSYQSGAFSSIEMVLSNGALETVNKFHDGILDYLSSVGANVSETAENMAKIIKGGVFHLTVNYYPEKNEETYFNQIIINSGKTSYYQITKQEGTVKKLYILYDNKDWNFKSSNDVCYQYKHSDRKVSLKNTEISYLDLSEFNPHSDVERIESFIHSNMESVFEKP